MAHSNTVYFLSNNPLPERIVKLALQTGVNHINTHYKKPSKRIFQYISNESQLPVIVIGDKWITDGIFADRIGAEFIKVRRVVENQESLIIKHIVIIDILLISIFFLLRIEVGGFATSTPLSRWLI